MNPLELPSDRDGWRAGVEKAIRRKEQERAVRVDRIPGRAWKARARAARLAQLNRQAGQKPRATYGEGRRR